MLCESRASQATMPSNGTRSSRMRRPLSPVGWLLDRDLPRPLSRAELSMSTTSDSRARDVAAPGIRRSELRHDALDEREIGLLRDDTLTRLRDAAVERQDDSAAAAGRQPRRRRC